MAEPILENLLVATFFFFIILTTQVQHEHEDSLRREHQDTQSNGEITRGGKSDGHRLFANPMWQPLCRILAHS